MLSELSLHNINQFLKQILLASDVNLTVWDCKREESIGSYKKQ